MMKFKINLNFHVESKDIEFSIDQTKKYTKRKKKLKKNKKNRIASVQDWSQTIFKTRNNNHAAVDIDEKQEILFDGCFF